MNARFEGLRVGAVSFLNTVPLIEGLQDQPGVLLSRDLPARLADQLEDDQIDVGLIPAVEYLRGVGRELVPGICIGARGAVRTVKVFSQVPLEEVEDVAVDRGSRSSIALLRVLLAERFGTSPDLHVIEPRPEALFAQLPAVLVIGDRADQVDPTGLHVYDLGELWHELTGLPFVFAAWVMSERMGRPENAQKRRRLVELLRGARARGLARLDELAVAEARARDMEVGDVLGYWNDSIQYALGDEELAGLRRFAQLAARHHLVPTEREVLVAEA